MFQLPYRTLISYSHASLISQSDSGIATFGIGALLTHAFMAGESVTGVEACVVGDVRGEVTGAFVRGTPTGKISVLSSLFFFCLGSGAAILLVEGRRSAVWQTLTLFVFLDVEAAKEHNGLFSVKTPVDGIRRIDTWTGISSISITLPGSRWSPLPRYSKAEQKDAGGNSLVADPHDTATPSKAIVETTKIDGTDAELAQSRGAHDARLDRDVQVGVLNDGRRIIG